MTTDQQIKGLYEKQIHIGFIRSKQNNEILTSEVCSVEYLKLVLHEEHLFVMLRNIPIKSLVDEPFILFPRHFGTNFYDVIISYFLGTWSKFKYCSRSDSNANDCEFSCSRNGDFCRSIINGKL